MDIEKIGPLAAIGIALCAVTIAVWKVEQPHPLQHGIQYGQTSALNAQARAPIRDLNDYLQRCPEFIRDLRDSENCPINYE